MDSGAAMERVGTFDWMGLRSIRVAGYGWDARDVFEGARVLSGLDELLREGLHSGSCCS